MSLGNIGIIIIAPIGVSLVSEWRQASNELIKILEGAMDVRLTLISREKIKGNRLTTSKNEDKTRFQVVNLKLYRKICFKNTT